MCCMLISSATCHPLISQQIEGTFHELTPFPAGEGTYVDRTSFQASECTEVVPLCTPLSHAACCDRNTRLSPLGANRGEKALGSCPVSCTASCRPEKPATAAFAFAAFAFAASGAAAAASAAAASAAAASAAPFAAAVGASIEAGEPLSLPPAAEASGARAAHSAQGRLKQ